MAFARVRAKAEQAARKGANPTQPIAGAKMPSVRPNRMVGDFGPGENYPGTARFTKIQTRGGGASGRTPE